MSKLLITGATGTVGSALVKTLKSRGLDFSVMTSKSGQKIADIPTVHGDFSRPETLTEAFRGVDTLFLLLPLVPEMPEFGRNAIAAAKAAGVKHIIRSSGAGADSDSSFAIARVHGEIDRLLQQSGLAATILRPTSFMQNHLTYNFEQIVSGTYYAPHGTGATSLIDVQDIAECVAAILADLDAHIGRAYTLTGSEAINDADQMSAISRASGHAVRYVDIPEEEAMEGMKNMGFPTVIVEWLMSLSAVIKAGYASGISNDVHQLTGHPPRRFADFVQANATRWLAKH